MKPRSVLLWDLLAGVSPTPAAAPASGSEAALRESIRHELSLLFNSTALSADAAFEHLAQAARSTLNYGLPNLAGSTATSIDASWLAAQLARAIRWFEPRLRADSVQVRVRPLHASRHNVLGFEIDAAFQHHPDAAPMQLDSELDLESGTVRVLERTRALRAAS